MEKLKNKPWTQEEKDYLSDVYGTKTLNKICEDLNRTETAIQNMVVRLGIGRWYENLEEITLNQLGVALNVSYCTVRSWCEKYGFPYKEKKFKKQKIKIVSIESFWGWAKENKASIEWDKVEKYILGKEPEWVEEARNAAFKTKFSQRKSYKKIAWSKDEDELLKFLINKNKFTYPQICEKLGRNHGAVKKRLLDLGIEGRPLKLDTTKAYSENDTKIIFEMLEDGHSMMNIAKKLNRSEMGVRGKIERMGYFFQNGVAIKKEEIA